MNPGVETVQIIAGVSNGIAQAQTPGGAGNLTLNGSLVTSGVATFDAARRVIITSSSGSDSGLVFTIYGTNRSGVAQSETITGVTTTPVQSVYDYATVTRIAVSAGSVGTITAGTNSVASSPWIVLDFLCRTWALAGYYTATGGTAQCEYTYDDPNTQPGAAIVGAEQWGMMPKGAIPPVLFNTGAASSGAELNLGAAGTAPYFADRPIFAIRVTNVTGTQLDRIVVIQAGMGAGY